MSKKNERDDLFAATEIDRRRDEVVRRMANTPPQPKPTAVPHRGKKKKAAGGHVAGKVRADRERKT